MWLSAFLPPISAQTSLLNSQSFRQTRHSCSLNRSEEEELSQLAKDHTLESLHQRLPLSKFWLNLQPEYPNMSDRAVRYLVLFSTTYSCEQSFSSLSVIKTKHRNPLDVQKRLSETTLLPRLQLLLEDKQQQASH